MNKKTLAKAKTDALATLKAITSPTRDDKLHDASLFSAIKTARDAATKAINDVKTVEAVSKALKDGTTKLNKAISNYNTSTRTIQEDIESVKTALEAQKGTGIIIDKTITNVENVKNEIIINLNSLGIDLKGCTITVSSIGSLKQNGVKNSDTVITISKDGVSSNMILSNIIWEEKEYQIKEDVLYVKQKLEKIKFLIPKFINQNNDIKTFIIEKSKSLGINLRGCSLEIILSKNLDNIKNILINVKKDNYYEEIELYAYFNTDYFDVNAIKNYLSHYKESLIQVSSTINSTDLAAASIKLQIEFILLKQFPILKDCSIKVVSLGLLQKSDKPFRMNIKISKKNEEKFIFLNNVVWK